MGEPVQKKRLPGKARPAKVALAEYEATRRTALNNATKRGVPDLLANLLVDIHIGPDPEKVVRWRIQLDCGCILEVNLPDSKEPHEIRMRDPRFTDYRLPEAEMLCTEEAHQSDRHPWRSITEYKTRDLTEHDADPVEPPDYLVDVPGGDTVWASIRHPQPHQRATWTVMLECGHAGSQTVDPDWKPDDGHPPSITPKRRDELLAELEQYELHSIDVESVRALCPKPARRIECRTCSDARPIVAVERVGPLVPAPKPPQVKKSEKELLTERLGRAEAEAERLRKQLEQAGDD